MAALHLDVHGLHEFDPIALRANECVGCGCDADIVQRVAQLSLSPLRLEADSDMDETHRSTNRRALSAFDSPSYSPLASSITSYEGDSVSGSSLSSLSPAPSLYSLTDSIREQAIHFLYGRGVNTHSDVYRIAGDEQEAERQDKQYSTLKHIMGDDVPPLGGFLTDSESGPSKKKTCLDIGCGSGAWILEVARRFPHVDCTAVDLVPFPAETQFPPNLRFEIDDVNLGLEHFENQFDVVHASHISSGIRDYYRLIEDTALSLHAGGLADFTEIDYRIYDLDHRPIVPTAREIWGNVEPPEGWIGTGMARSAPELVRRQITASGSLRSSVPSPFFARFFVLIGQASRKRGGNVDASALLHPWILGHRAYEDVVAREFWVPTGPWMRNWDVLMRDDFGNLSEDELAKLCQQGDELREEILEFMQSTRPLLLSTGVPEGVVDYLETNAAKELMECKIPSYVRLQNVYACKKRGGR